MVTVASPQGGAVAHNRPDFQIRAKPMRNLKGVGVGVGVMISGVSQV